MKIYDKTDFLKSKYFWRAKRRWERIVLKGNTGIYTILKHSRTEWQKGQVLKSFVTGVLPSFCKVLATVSILYFIEFLAGNFWKAHHGSFPTWLEQLFIAIPKPTYPGDKEQIIQLFSVIASISGVVLALFYPVLATIASTAYAKVHSNIRNLLFTDTNINGYLKNLTRLASLSVLNLFALSLGFQPGNLILFVICMYGIVMLYNILKVGLNVYELFNPATLMIGVGDELITHIGNVTVRGRFWSEPNFQKFYRDRAIDCLNRIQTLTQLCQQDAQLNDIAYSSIARRSFVLLNYYLLEKPRIPASSKWYPEVNVYNSLLAQSEINREVFQSMKTTVQMDHTTNYSWFEDRIISIFLDQGVHSAETAATRFAISASAVGQTINVLATLGSLETGQQILQKLKSELEQITQKKEDDETYFLYRIKLALSEGYYSLVVSFVWESLAKIESMTLETFSGELQKINWEKKSSLYQTAFYPDSFEELEKMVARIRFETEVEGQRVTADWFLDQEVLYLYLKRASVIMASVTGLIDTLLLSLVIQWNREQKYLLSTRLLLHCLELIIKIRIKLRNVRTCFDSLTAKYKRSLNSDWKLFDFAASEKKLDSVESALYAVLPASHLAMSVITWDKKSPDLFSMTHLAISQRICKVLAGNRTEDFKILFENYPMACVASYTGLKSQYENATYALKYASQPILDLLEISGLAYIYSKLHGNSSLWDICCNAWDETVKDWAPEQFRLLPAIYEASRGFATGGPFNYAESHARKMALSGFVQREKPVITDQVLQLFFTPTDPDGNFNYLHIDEIFLELKYFTYPGAKETEALVRERRLFSALNPKP